jgi:hypothetical protein
MLGQAEWNLHVRAAALRFLLECSYWARDSCSLRHITEDAGLGWKLTTMSRCTPEDSGTLD